MSKRDLLLNKIERIVELEYNQLDKQLINNEIDQDKYNEEARDIDAWARAMYSDMDEV